VAYRHTVPGTDTNNLAWIFRSIKCWQLHHPSNHPSCHEVTTFAARFSVFLHHALVLHIVLNHEKVLSPQFAQHHYRYPRAQSVSFFHVMCSENGSAIRTLECSTDGVPAHKARKTQKLSLEPVISDNHLNVAVASTQSHPPHESLGLRIHSSRRFVQQNHLGIPQHSDRKAQFTFGASG